jgi:hypothetical protein
MSRRAPPLALSHAAIPEYLASGGTPPYAASRFLKRMLRLTCVWTFNAGPLWRCRLAVDQAKRFSSDWCRA